MTEELETILMDLRSLVSTLYAVSIDLLDADGDPTNISAALLEAQNIADDVEDLLDT